HDRDGSLMPQNLIEFDQQSQTLFCQGEWTLPSIAKIRNILKGQFRFIQNAIIIDGKSITRLDSAGAWLLLYGIKSEIKREVKITFQNFSDQHQKLMAFITNKKSSGKPIPKSEKLDWVQSLGKYGIFQMKEFH